jgi:hypothetical protein
MSNGGQNSNQSQNNINNNNNSNNVKAKITKLGEELKTLLSGKSLSELILLNSIKDDYVNRFLEQYKRNNLALIDSASQSLSI